MKNVVITIARHFGSGGKTVGKMLSEDLGIGFYEHEIIEMASEDSGIAEELFNQADEKLKRTPLFFWKSTWRVQGKADRAGQRRVCQRPQPVQLSGEDHPRACAA